MRAGFNSKLYLANMILSDLFCLIELVLYLSEIVCPIREVERNQMKSNVNNYYNDEYMNSVICISKILEIK